MTIPTPPSCEALQERIARGEPTSDDEQAHVLSCSACRALAAEWMALDAMITDGLDPDAVVPAGFADAVMARLAGEPAPARAPGDSAVARRLTDLLGRRWFQMALAHVGVAAAIANLIRVVFSALVPTISLGGSP